ncbi:MAG TPA: ATP-binding protein [Terriglobia bacterium]|nr:ATP-binding protein [Terriglobia bacterium]
MNPTPQVRFTTLLVALLSGALIVCGYLNFRQRANYQLPTDGVSWVDSSDGVQAWIVAAAGPASSAGIREGDLLVSVDGVAVKRASDAARAVFRSGVWSSLTYGLVRQGQRFDAQVVVTPQANSSPLRHYLDFVGLLYLFIGAFILLRRWTAAKSLHFYFFCLASFVLFTFSYTGKLNTFDWTVYWLNVAAWILTPALFLHFCLSFPERPQWLARRRYAIPLVYGPGALLGGVHVLVSAGILTLAMPLAAARWAVDRVEIGYLAVYFLLGAAALQHSYRRARSPLLKQQLKWVTRGTCVAIVPFFLLYAVPYFLGYLPTLWMKASVFSLIFLPLTFGYAIVRYRLMDVDIIFRRGIAYTLATLSIVGVYFAVIALFADYFHNWVPETGHGGWIFAIIVTALLFQPLVKWIQARLDRFFNPERYDYRQTLLDFARELTSELHVGRLVDRVTERLGETLDVERVAIVLATGSGDFRLASARGFTFSGDPDFSYLNPHRAELGKGYLFFDSVRRAFGVSPEARATIEQLDLHYYLPFKVKGQTLGYLGLGKTRHGDFLSSEDISLIETLAGYVSIALESAGLYESLEQTALQHQALKDFSESIIESISAGVLAVNLEERVESWNSAMETLYGLERSQACGRRLAEIFPPELISELPSNGASHQAFSLYKFRLSTADGRQLIVNTSMAPLVGKDGSVIGHLLIFTDLTERVSLEDQLVQAEKLSSIGLLAAGVAHEVNTPLAVIASQAQMLARQMPAEDARSRIVEKIIKQSFRASEIVNSLLKFSRVSGSEYSELDLNKVIQETLSLIEPMLKASRISLNLQLASGLPAVHGNAGKLQQVFMNLLVNARDAMPHGGDLTLVTECENSTVRAEVCDTGIGIPADNLSRIFDPFFTTKSTGRGTGLGLAVTYGIMREHSGNVQVESRVGRGTTFRLELPAARKTVNAV